MNYGSVCSGIEAASLAWNPLGWRAKFVAEVEPFPSAVLCRRWNASRPKRPLDPAEAHNEKDRKLRESWKKQIERLPADGLVPNLGDFTKIQKGDYDGEIDLLVGGCPCQSYSLAGLRKGLSDPRGNLSLEFVKLAYRTGARLLVFENVPGILSSGDGGSDFAGFLSLLCGWEVKPPANGWRRCGIVSPAPGCFGVAWRILDAQYTRVPEFPGAVPQRRRRLILVGHLDSWRYPAKVLFDGEMLGGNTTPRRTKGQGIASSAEGGADAAEPDGVNVPGDACIDIRHTDIVEHSVAPTLIATDYKGGKAVCFEHHAQDARIKPVDVAQTLSARMGTGGNNLPLVQETIGFIKNDAGGAKDGYGNEVFPTLRSQVIPAVARQECFNVTFCDANGVRKDRRDGGLYVTEAESGRTITTGGTNADTVVIERESDNATVRRLLPLEGERLMGMPDGYTKIPWKGMPESECPDAPRYKALGNSMAVNVMAWVGRRIQQVEKEAGDGRE